MYVSRFVFVLSVYVLCFKFKICFSVSGLFISVSLSDVSYFCFNIFVSLCQLCMIAVSLCLIFMMVVSRFVSHG